MTTFDTWIKSYVDENCKAYLKDRTLLCNENVKKYTPLFSIPKSICMTIDQACTIHEQLDNPAFDSSQILTCFLALEYQKKTNSFWYPYIEILPKDDVFVDEWPEDVIHDLGLDVLVQGKRAEIRSRYQQVTHIINDFTLYRWAFWMVESRAFLGRFHTDNMHPVLIPYADMLNHDPRNADSAEFSKDCFTLVADRDIRRDSPIYNSYGRKTNRDLILSYGFALEDNCWEYLTIPIPWTSNVYIHSASSLEKNKLSFLAQYDQDDLRLNLFSVPNRVLLSLFRVYVALKKEQLDLIRENWGFPISEENERDALRALLTTLEKVPLCSYIGEYEMGANYALCRKNIIDAHLRYLTNELSKYSYP